MKRMKKIGGIVTLLASLVGTHPLNADETPQAQDMKAFADYIRAQGEYARAMAEANLFNAQAQLKLAEAAHEFQRVRQLTLLVNRLALTLRKVARQEYALEKKIERVLQASMRTNLLKTGTSSPTIISSLNFIITQTVPASVLRDIMEVPVDAFTVANFKHNQRGRQVEEFHGANVGQLFDFLKYHDYSFVAFSPAHLVVLDAIDSLTGYVGKEVASLQQQVRDLTEQIARHTPKDPVPGPKALLPIA